MSWAGSFKQAASGGIHEFRDPASELEIENLRNFFAFELPSDLVEFLQVSNGLYIDNNGWIRPAIASVAEIIELTQEARSLPKKYAHFREIDRLILIGYEPNFHCFTVYYLPRQLSVESFVNDCGVYEFSPEEPEDPIPQNRKRKGFVRFETSDLADYLRVKFT